MKIQAVSAMRVSFMGKIPSENFSAGEIKDIHDEEAALLAIFNYKGVLRLLHPCPTATGVGLQDITEKVIPLIGRMQQAILENDTKAFCEVGLWAKQLLTVPVPKEFQDPMALAAQIPESPSLMGGLIALMDWQDNKQQALQPVLCKIEEALGLLSALKADLDWQALLAILRELLATAASVGLRTLPVEGLDDMTDTIKAISERLRPGISVDGLLDLQTEAQRLLDRIKVA